MSYEAGGGDYGYGGSWGGADGLGGFTGGGGGSSAWGDMMGTNYDFTTGLNEWGGYVGGGAYGTGLDYGIGNHSSNEAVDAYMASLPQGEVDRMSRASINVPDWQTSYFNRQNAPAPVAATTGLDFGIDQGTTAADLGNLNIGDYSADYGQNLGNIGQDVSTMSGVLGESAETSVPFQGMQDLHNANVSEKAKEMGLKGIKYGLIPGLLSYLYGAAKEQTSGELAEMNAAFNAIDTGPADWGEGGGGGHGGYTPNYNVYGGNIPGSTTGLSQGYGAAGGVGGAGTTPLDQSATATAITQNFQTHLTSQEIDMFQRLEDSMIKNSMLNVEENADKMFQSEIARMADAGVLQGDLGVRGMEAVADDVNKYVANANVQIRGQILQEKLDYMHNKGLLSLDQYKTETARLLSEKGLALQSEGLDVQRVRYTTGGITGKCSITTVGRKQ